MTVSSSLRLFFVSLPGLFFASVLVTACGSSDTTDIGGGEGGAGEETCGNVILNGGGGIARPPNGATLCAAGDCNYQTQAGCSADQSCRPLAPAGATSIRPGCEPFGTGRSGDACTSSQACARGFMCAGNACRKQCCRGDWSACEAGESCIREFYIDLGQGNVTYAVDLCFPVNNCDVLDPASSECEAGRECKIVDPTGAVACAPKSQAGVGDACAPPNVCSQGSTCIIGPDGGRCRRLCRAEVCGEPRCLEGEGSCVRYDRDPPGVGECTPNR